MNYNSHGLAKLIKLAWNAFLLHTMNIKQRINSERVLQKVIDAS